MIRLKRVYAPWHRGDGFRVLVDRLWPRGLSKERAHVDLWLRDIAPSSDLRRQFAHNPERWQQFQTGYRKELTSQTVLLQLLVTLEREKRAVTLLYAASDEQHNNAVVLEAFLGEQRGRARRVG